MSAWFRSRAVCLFLSALFLTTGGYSDWSVTLRVSALFLTTGSSAVLSALFLTTGGYLVWSELWRVQEICRGSDYDLRLSTLLPAFCLIFVMLCSFFVIFLFFLMFTLGVAGGDY